VTEREIYDAGLRDHIAWGSWAPDVESAMPPEEQPPPPSIKEPCPLCGFPIKAVVEEFGTARIDHSDGRECRLVRSGGKWVRA
jgi:hypothetical protein